MSELDEEELRGSPETLVALSPSQRLTGPAAPALEAYVASRLARCARALLVQATLMRRKAGEDTATDTNTTASRNEAAGGETSSKEGSTTSTGNSSSNIEQHPPNSTFPAEVASSNGGEVSSPVGPALLAGVVTGAVASLVSPLVLVACACVFLRLRRRSLEARARGNREGDLEMGGTPPTVEMPLEGEEGCGRLGWAGMSAIVRA